MIKSAELKDIGVLSCWVTGLLLIISLLWILTQPVQKHYLLRAVNSVFIHNNDDRRLSRSLPAARAVKAGILGHWYLMHNSPNKMFVFVIFQDGILVPLGAVVSDDGVVQEIIPLSAHAVQVFDALAESILRMYVTRIETAAVSLSEHVYSGHTFLGDANREGNR